MMLAARCRVSMSPWSWVIWTCLAWMAFVISLKARLLRPLGAFTVHEWSVCQEVGWSGQAPGTADVLTLNTMPRELIPASWIARGVSAISGVCSLTSRLRAYHHRRHPEGIPETDRVETNRAPGNDAFLERGRHTFGSTPPSRYNGPVPKRPWPSPRHPTLALRRDRPHQGGPVVELLPPTVTVALADKRGGHDG